MTRQFVTHVLTSIATLLFRCLRFLCWVVETRSEFWLFSLCQLYILQVFSLCCSFFHSVYGGCGAMEFLNVYVVRSINQRLNFSVEGKKNGAWRFKMSHSWPFPLDCSCSLTWNKTPLFHWISMLPATSVHPAPPHPQLHGDPGRDFDKA